MNLIGDGNMITLFLIACAIVAIVVFILTFIGVVGTGVLMIFGDLIVAIAVIWALIHFIRNRKNK